MDASRGADGVLVRGSGALWEGVFLDSCRPADVKDATSFVTHTCTVPVLTRRYVSSQNSEQLGGQGEESTQPLFSRSSCLVVSSSDEAEGPGPAHCLPVV